VIWKFIQKGEKPIILFHSSYDYKQDYRIQFLQREGEVEIHQNPDTDYERYVPGPGAARSKSLFERLEAKLYIRIRNKHSMLGRSFVGKLYRRLYFDCSQEMNWLREKDIYAVVFEWNTPTGRGIVLERFFYAAKGLGIPTFSIPHGCNTHLSSDIHDNDRKLMAKGRMPSFIDRNEFDYYVVQSRYHLEYYVRFGLDRSRIQAWGSTRFYPEWQKMNLELCNQFLPQKDPGDRLRVVFMLPHWNYNVDKPATLSLLGRLSELPWVHLVIKDHTRGSVGLLPVKHQEKYDAMDNVEVSIGVHSPSLVQWSDVVINLNSSIGLEVLLQDKALIHTGYLQSNWTTFDETGAALLAHNHQQVIEYLEALKNGIKITIPEESIEAVFRSVIYGGRDPFDVLEYYYDQISSKKVLL